MLEAFFCQREILLRCGSWAQIGAETQAELHVFVDLKPTLLSGQDKLIEVPDFHGGGSGNLIAQSQIRPVLLQQALIQ